MILCSLILATLLHANEGTANAPQGIISCRQLFLVQHLVGGEDTNGPWYWAAEVNPIAFETTKVTRRLQLAQGFFVSAVLQNNGNLILDFYLRNEKGRAEFLRGAEEFDAIMRHFDRRIKKIVAIWHPGSDNRIAYDNAIERGLNPYDAISSTWTGRMAAKHGFTTIRRNYNLHPEDSEKDAISFYFSR